MAVATKMEEVQRQNLRAIVRGAYDIQKLRIQMGNRIVGNFKVKMGQEPGKKEDEIDAEGKMILSEIRRDFAKITDGFTKMPTARKFKGQGVISEYTELVLVAEYIELERSEEGHFKRMGKVVEAHPLWGAFLRDVKGCGAAMAGVILSEIDITKARYVSSLWKYAGLDVGTDGKGRSRREEHLTEYEYVSKEGEIKKRKGITFNPFLKTKLVGVLGPCFLKAGGPYSEVYRDYKHRLEGHAEYGEESKGHRHNMATRYMVKMFLKDLYVAWRPLEGLPVHAPYQEAKLGHVHGEAA